MSEFAALAANSQTSCQDLVANFSTENGEDFLLLGILRVCSDLSVRQYMEVFDKSLNRAKTCQLISPTASSYGVPRQAPE